MAFSYINYITVNNLSIYLTVISAKEIMSIYLKKIHLDSIQTR